jgi:hypothetical protein
MESIQPNFICIGAQRAGTTWLYHCLKEHPQVFVSDKKELRFFNYHYNDGIESYQHNFKQVSNEIAIGELTPDYYHQEDALLRIKKHIPNIKLIFILRNPIHRAYSHYQLYYGTQYNKMTFRKTYLKHSDIIEWGKYGQHLKFIYKHFKKENILTIDYDLLKDHPDQFLTTVFTFLGISPKFRPSIVNKTFNKVIYPKTQKMMQRLKLQGFIKFIKNTVVGDFIRTKQHQKKSNITNDDYDYLANQFKDDIILLNSILKIDYSHWLSQQSSS